MAATTFILVDPAASSAQDAADSSITEAGGSVLINTNKFTVATASGNTAVAGTLASAGNFAVATSKFTVAAGTGNTVVAGTLGVTGDVAVGTNKLTVAAASGNTAVAGTIDVAGITTLGSGMVYSTTLVAGATYSVLVGDAFIYSSYSVTGTCAIDLPTAQLLDGRTIVIKDIGGDASTNNLTVTTEGAELIDGAATAVISTDYGKVTLQSDGTNWYTI